MKKDEIKKTIETLLGIIGFYGEVGVEEEEGSFRASVDLEQASHLIGQRGQTLLELEQILKQIFFKKFKEPSAFVLDINSYRRNREELIKTQALDGAAKAKREKRVVPLPPMNAYERRIVHLVLAEDGEIQTFSEGEGERRKVLIKPKSEFNF